MNKAKFYVNIDWFDVAEQPEDISLLPDEFKKARELWEDDAENNQSQMIELLAKYVGARLVLSNISDWEELFIDEDGNFGEVESDEVKVIGIDFAHGPIPMCKAEAYFDLPVTADFADTDLNEWQEEHDPFHLAVVFYWDLVGDSLDDLDLNSGDNQGVEFVYQNGLDQEQTDNEESNEADENCITLYNLNTDQANRLYELIKDGFLKNFIDIDRLNNLQEDTIIYENLNVAVKNALASYLGPLGIDYR